MHGWGASGILLILVVIIVLVNLFKMIVRSAINQSELKRSVDNDLKVIKEDIRKIAEHLDSKDQ